MVLKGFKGLDEKTLRFKFSDYLRCATMQYHLKDNLPIKWANSINHQVEFICFLVVVDVSESVRLAVDIQFF